MDPIEPTLPERPSLLPIHGASRAAAASRDGGGNGGRGGAGGRRRQPHRDSSEAVEVVIDGVAGAPDPAIEAAPPTHRIDLTA